MYHIWYAACFHAHKIIHTPLNVFCKFVLLYKYCALVVWYIKYLLHLYLFGGGGACMIALTCELVCSVMNGFPLLQLMKTVKYACCTTYVTDYHTICYLLAHSKCQGSCPIVHCMFILIVAGLGCLLVGLKNYHLVTYIHVRVPVNNPPEHAMANAEFPLTDRHSWQMVLF